MLICSCEQSDNYNAETLDANWTHSANQGDSTFTAQQIKPKKKKKNPLQVEPKSNNMCKHSTNSGRTSL